MDERLKKLAADPALKIAINNLNGWFKGSIPKDLVDLLSDISSNGRVKPQQLVNWVINVQRAVKLILSDQTNPSDYSVFWIGIYGLTTEVQAYFKDWVDQLTSLGASSDSGVLKTYSNLLRATAEVEQAFSDDDLIVIDVERQTHSHSTWPQNYWPCLA